MLETKIGAAIIVFVVAYLFTEAAAEGTTFAKLLWSALLALGVYLTL